MNDARWQYDSVTQISIGDNIYYRDNWYQVLINYISGETDKTGYTPVSYTHLTLPTNREV